MYVCVGSGGEGGGLEMISPSFMMVFFVDLLVSKLVALLVVVHLLNMVIICYRIPSYLFFQKQYRK